MTGTISLSKVIQWIKINSALLGNAASLVGTTGVTSVLGFAYWWLAARQFSPDAVGFASTAISNMTLFATISILGLDTLLVGELPRQRGQEAPLIITALIVVGSVGSGLGLIFALIAPYVSADLQGLRANIGSIVLFALGVGFTSITLVLDQALIGLLKGGFQLWRNTLFAIVKFAALFIVGLWLSQATGLTIYATWTIGNAVSLLVLAGIALMKGVKPGKHLLPQFELLRKLGLAAIKHHILNLAIFIPPLILPTLVTAALSAAVGGWFYISWNLASLGNIVISALTMALYAVSAAQPEMFVRRIRLTLGLSFLACIFINILFLFGTQQILEFFGHSYAEQAAWSLRILSLESFLFIVKGHYIAISRIHGRVARSALITVATGSLEVGGAALGVYLGGLTGLSLGWLAAMCIEAIFMFPTVYKAARFIVPSSQELRDEFFTVELGSLDTPAETQPIWLMDTLIQPIGNTDTLIQPTWLADTLTLTAVLVPKQPTDADSESDDDVHLRPTIRLAAFPQYTDEKTVKLPVLKKVK
ncbi:MAG: oligosaccharide flippase family protein [Ktedonobacteraceae bacterium]|nr:oligosaccharide flippase family protein [Ktedonobacteraceae bacterium]